MSHILVTGSGAGLGLGAARELTAQGHTVMLHARSADRAHEEPEVEDLLERGARLVTGDLADLDQVRDLAVQVDRLGGVDAIIHNAGVLNGRAILPVNVVAPYLLTALVPAERLVFLSSGMHRGGHATLDGLDWAGTRRTASYSDSKLLVTALAAAVGRIRPGVPSNAVDPGWVPTRMGGAGAPDDLELGHRTQAWLAAGMDPATDVSAYWFHQRRQDPHPSVRDERFQDALLDALAAHTGARLAD
jgi:NAD(P)-dependent dehydrogenase (short-subunit alcohol dehydrogenase family)